VSLPDDAKDSMTKWLKPPIVAENEQLKARVIALEAEIGEATGRIETDGRLIAELEAEVARQAALRARSAP
jgi:cell division septum initiation protein DivIVA